MPKIAPVVTDKFRELVLYIAEKSADDPRFGAVKLNKILYYSDFAAYRILGSSITGDVYQHLAEGPAPVHLLTARGELIEDGSAQLEKRTYFNLSQDRLIPARKPKLDLFSGTEIAIVDQVIAALSEYNGRGVSDLSHMEFGVKTTELNAEIPYYTAWIGSDPLTPEQAQKGLEIAEAHGFAAPAG